MAARNVRAVWKKRLIQLKYEVNRDDFAQTRQAIGYLYRRTQSGPQLARHVDVSAFLLQRRRLVCAQIAQLLLNRADTLTGSAGDDELYGFGGNDVLNPGLGKMTPYEETRAKIHLFSTRL